MTFITLDLAKVQQRIDGIDEDALLAVLIAASELAAIQYLNRQVYESQEALDAAVLDGTAGDCPMVINDAVRAAMLLIFGHLYANREDVVIGASVTELPHGSTRLLDLFREHTGA